MPTYAMSAPNGQTYQIDGPDGATDDQVRAEILRQHPDAGSAPAPPAKPPGIIDQVVGAAKQYGASIAHDYNQADTAYRADMGKIHAQQQAGQPSSLLDNAKPVMDAANAAISPFTGAMHQAFGDQPLHLPAQVAGVQVPQWAQNVNSKGLSGGDIASMAVPVAGDVNAARATAAAARAAGVGQETMRATLAASKPNPLAVAAKPVAAPGAAPIVQAVKGDPAATVEALRGAKSAAYGAVDSAGVQYSPDAFKSMVDSIEQAAAKANISPDRHPAATSMIADLKAMADKGTSPTLTQMDQLRQVVRRDVASKHDEAEAFFGKRIIDGIDNFIQSAQPADVVSGKSGQASDMIATARSANAQYRKAEAVTDAIDSAKLRAGSTGSGANSDNAIRQNLRRVLENTPNLTDDEQAALKGLVLGGTGQNLLRFAGKASPAAGGLSSLASLAATTASHGTLGVPLMASAGAKFAADAMTSAKVNDLLDLIAAGGQRANVAQVKAWTGRMAQVAKTNSPAVISSQVGRLRVAARSNPALVPLYQQSLKLLPAAGAVRSAAASGNSPAQ
jgi:hypothetical protein